MTLPPREAPASAIRDLEPLVRRTIERALAIQAIAAPTFGEGERAEYVRARLARLPLSDVELAADGNVYARLPGARRRPAIALTAHLDTVFPSETSLVSRREGTRLHGPGMGDNSLGVAGLISLAEALAAAQRRPRDIWFVANVGEEGLGNLSGMWSAMHRLKERLGAAVILEGGSFGSVIHRGIGVARRRIGVRCEGGHAWSDFGAASAIHELCRIGASIAAIRPPTEPRTSYNIGRIEGGRSINTIAEQASLLLDLRSEDPIMLDRLARRIDRLVAAAGRPGVEVTSEAIGERPAGGIPEEHPLVRGAIESLRALGHPEPTRRAASTDANVPLAIGIPALCIGLAEGHNAHRLDEFVDVGPLDRGLLHVLQVLEEVDGYLDGEEPPA